MERKETHLEKRCAKGWKTTSGLLQGVESGVRMGLPGTSKDDAKITGDDENQSGLSV